MNDINYNPATISVLQLTKTAQPEWFNKWFIRPISKSIERSGQTIGSTFTRGFSKELGDIGWKALQVVGFPALGGGLAYLASRYMYPLSSNSEEERRRKETRFWTTLGGAGLGALLAAYNLGAFDYFFPSAASKKKNK